MGERRLFAALTIALRHPLGLFPTFAAGIVAYLATGYLVDPNLTAARSFATLAAPAWLFLGPAWVIERRRSDAEVIPLPDATEPDRDAARDAEDDDKSPGEARGPAVQQLSLDGAMVPLVGGAWAEVKTLALGEVEQTTAADGRVRIRATALSYFSRMTDAETFRDLARGELYRRGTAAATVVCAVQDGAEWQQRFVDHHRPDAVRILDFPHALEHLGTVGRAVFGSGTAAFSDWLGIQAHTFKHGDPDQVLAAERTLDLTTAVDPEAARHQAEALAYFEKRRAQIAYADFRAAGYPIGSGAVESANKLVVKARLKGSGKHWDRASVSPMVCLRDLLCSDRWITEWPATWRAHLAAARRRPRPAADARPDAPPTPATPPLPPANSRGPSGMALSRASLRWPQPSLTSAAPLACFCRVSPSRVKHDAALWRGRSADRRPVAAGDLTLAHSHSSS